MKSSFLQHLFGKVPFFAPLHSLADHDAVVTLHLLGWRLLRFAYHPHLNPLPSRERKFWLAIMDASLVRNELCIPRKEKKHG